MTQIQIEIRKKPAVFNVVQTLTNNELMPSLPANLAFVQEFRVTPADKPLTVYYCKTNLPSGNTIRICQGTKILLDCRGISGSLEDFDLIHENSTGQAKASGANCVINVRAGTFKAYLLTSGELVNMPQSKLFNFYNRRNLNTGKTLTIVDKQSQTMIDARGITGRVDNFDLMHVSGVCPKCIMNIWRGSVQVLEVA